LPIIGGTSEVKPHVYEPSSDKWFPMLGDNEGHAYTKGYVKDPTTLSWTAEVQGVIKTDNLSVTAQSDNYGYTGSAWESIYSDGSHNLRTTIQAQGIVIDTNNSYTGTVAGLATKPFTATNVTPITSIQVYFAADQNCIIYVDQGSSSSVFGIVDFFNYYPSVPESGSYTVTSAAPYFRIRVTNLSTTAVNVVMYSATVPILSTLPRSLDDEGYLKIGTKSIRGKMGRVRISPMGAQKGATSVRLVGTTFVGTIFDGNFWSFAQVTSASATQAYGELTLSTLTTANDGVLVTSKRTARYVAANPNYFRANLSCPAATTTIGTLKRRWGAFNATDGFFFELSQANGATAGVLTLVSRKTVAGPTTTDTPITSFNGDYGASYIVDTNIHTYEIWWSNKSVYFWIDDILLHTFNTSAQSTPTSTLTLNVGFQVLNAGGNTANNTIIVRTGTINRLGNMLHKPTSYYRTTTVAAQILKYGPGSLHGIAIGIPTDTANVILYDALAATGGTELFSTGPMAVKANNNVMPTYIDLKGIPFFTGLTLAIVTANCVVTVMYE
jgi:hypothetical protein